MILNTSNSSGNIFQGSLDGLNTLQRNSSKGMNIQKISTLKKSDFMLPKIKQEIQKSYDDPYREDRFVEKDLSYYKIQRYNKNGYKRFENNNMIGKSASYQVVNNSNNQTPRKEILHTQNSYMESSPLNIRQKANLEISPKFQQSKMNQSNSSAQILNSISDIAQNYNSALVKKSKNLMINQNYQAFNPIKVFQKDRKKSIEQKIEEDSKINKNLNQIRNLLVSQNTPLVQESYGQKFQKYFVGHRVPTYFHKANQ
ncbi:hypothetical protein TTHERM_00335760 (macronuclear) [Tetrahymena thermophila SB210]|uniref:Uncharacterized protein n=1 Tax=Tetrahymena thermophila (strain SB210) TaxID=312017 RepID=I7M873_TETTS|nr:hypothetical protein TTHERM_00335760 [Tetrahymena thermophila SB210]EAR97299.1 hypothetical protein TTHERM_00335760 [Tetrahymena thermophila SB210]|eukprot:XP_001017544.1 hypothetical protein TTHERM_00335760 [Tetrahymena thermophila SB210]